MGSADPDAPAATASSVNDLIVTIRSPNPYYTSTYFPSSYFYGGLLDSGSMDGELIAGRDATGYATLVTLLKATGAFDSVIFGDPTSPLSTGASSHPLAIVTPKGWDELDETDPVEWVRRASFTIRVVVQVEADTSAFEQLDSLATLVQTSVDQADLGGSCLPALTKIRSGRYGTSNQYPEWSIDLDGEFTELIDPPSQMVPL